MNKLEETFKKKCLEYLGEDTTSEPEGWYFKKKYALEPMLLVKELLSLIEIERKEAVEGFVEGYKRHLKDRAGFKGKVCALLTHGKDSQAYWDLKVFERKFEQYLTQTKGETK